MYRPIIVKQHMAKNSGFNSEKMNLFRNQLYSSLKRIFAILDKQKQAIEEDIDICLDSSSPYSPNKYHPYESDIILNLNGSLKDFIDIHETHNKCASLDLKIKQLLRSL